MQDISLYLTQKSAFHVQKLEKIGIRCADLVLAKKALARHLDALIVSDKV
jgi:hypothetical protein